MSTQSRGAPPPASDSPRLSALDGLPHPDYRDYFEAIGRHDRERVLGRTPVKLPIEFSRGCWWGEKHHCTFCGLNALGMGYRAKSAERALDELAGLLRDYPAVHVEAVDNILDMKYISSLVPELAARHWDVHIFFEVKANLTREQLAGLRSAGIMRIQPGIESLSSAVLDLMRKGSSKLLNIRLLKWAGYYGIGVAWNLLTGFPGETDDDYRRQAELMPLLHHLEPPAVRAVSGSNASARTSPMTRRPLPTRGPAAVTGTSTPPIWTTRRSPTSSTTRRRTSARTGLSRSSRTRPHSGGNGGPRDVPG